MPPLSDAAQRVLANANIGAAALNAGSSVAVKAIEIADSKINMLLQLVISNAQFEQMLKQLEGVDPALATEILKATGKI